ncbi:hypothetical protein CLV56_3998 [Mumia flava]|uniref:CHAP domain-containing protein n=1 Tax=Mumia flava TaxID=1348852 RepID=A0A0B2BSR2_9ACTN|nr:hypothetical protein [Mumia flava]PJJ48293.1 hypothetical protein CLV56_3998 [Mumia flava]
MTKPAPRMGEAAVAYAAGKIGHNKMPEAGYCQLFTRGCYGVPSSGNFDGDKDADAVDAWKRAKAHGTVVATTKSQKIPRGAAVYWSGGSNGHGHAAVALGKGRVISTDVNGARSVGRAHIDDLSRRWGLTLLGYVLVDGNGYQFRKRPIRRPADVGTAIQAAREARKNAKASGKKVRTRRTNRALSWLYKIGRK